MNSDLKAQLRELFITAAKVFDFVLYRPQMKFARVMFLHVSVILSRGYLGRYPPGPGTSPGTSACWEIWATSGRYASYWNAFLFNI